MHFALNSKLICLFNLHLIRKLSGQHHQQNSQNSTNGISTSSAQSSNNTIHSPNFYQYLTPPSQHSGGVTPQHLVQTLDSYPTPSPESPGHWSSSSPHSNSDWSEGIHSPSNTVYVTGGHQSNKGSEAIYI